MFLKPVFLHGIFKKVIGTFNLTIRTVLLAVVNILKSSNCEIESGIYLSISLSRGGNKRP